MSHAPFSRSLSVAGWEDWEDAKVVRGIALSSASSSGAAGDDAAAAAAGSWWRVGQDRLRHQTKVVTGAVRQSPLTAVAPLLLACALIGFGLWAVFKTSDDYVASQRATALGVAKGAGLSLQTQFELVLGPCTALEACVMANPYMPTLNRTFDLVAAKLLSQATTTAATQLELMPFGKIEAMYPFYPGDKEVMNYDAIGPNARPGDIPCMTRTMQERTMCINFKQLIEGGFGAVVYYPVFVADVNANETFGLAQGPSQCKGCEFYNQTSREMWWGVVCAVILLNDLLVAGQDSRLNALLAQGYDYQLVLPPSGGLDAVAAAGLGSNYSQTIASSTDTFTTDPVQTVVLMPDGQVWDLYIAPQDPMGWQPTWKSGLIAMVVALSLATAGLLMAMLVKHQQYKRLVWNMLPKKVVQTLQRGHNYAEPFKQVTVLFSDIVSYTSMSSEMTPCCLVDLLNRLYSHYDSLCEKHGLFKVETIGDCFMCVAGCPNRCTPEEAARRAAAMAMDMLSFTNTFVNPDGRRIRIRVGMYSGDVTAAVVGSCMYHMCLIGDTVNVASRMESNSLPMRCHIGEPTARLLARFPEFKMASRGLLDIKGKGPMETFWLTAALVDPSASRHGPAPAGQALALVGLGAPMAAPVVPPGVTPRAISPRARTPRARVQLMMAAEIYGQGQGQGQGKGKEQAKGGEEPQQQREGLGQQQQGHERERREGEQEQGQQGQQGQRGQQGQQGSRGQQDASASAVTPCSARTLAERQQQGQLQPQQPSQLAKASCQAESACPKAAAAGATATPSPAPAQLLG